MDSKAIANQKVFVTLASVLEIQARFNETVEQVRSTPVQNQLFNRDRARGMAQVIRTLGLPINIPPGY